MGSPTGNSDTVRPPPPSVRGSAAPPAPVDPDPEGPSRRFAAGEPEGLAEVYARHAGWVHGLALRALGHQQDAEDVTQQVFVDAWRRRATFDPARGSVGAWLSGITRRRIIDRLVSRGRDTPIEAPAPDGRGIPGLAEDVLEMIVVATELRALPPAQAEVIRLAVYRELTHVEIAQATGLPLGTVKSHLRRGLTRLRHRWETTDVAPDV